LCATSRKRCATLESAVPRSYFSAVAIRSSVVIAVFGMAAGAFAQTLQNEVISDDPVTRQSALKRLAALTPEQKLPYLPILTRMILEKNGYRVVPAFARIGPPAVPHLQSLLSSQDGFVRAMSVRALAMIRPISADSVEALRRLLADPEVERYAAVSLLSLGVDDQRARVIANVLWQNQPKGRPIAGGIPAWIQALSSQDDFVKYDANMLLKETGAAAIPALLTALQNGDERLRFGAIGALAFMHSYRPDVEAACIGALKDPSPKVRDIARGVLQDQVSLAAHDALLGDEIAERLRLEAAEENSRNWLNSTHTREEVLAPLPPNSDHDYLLGVGDPVEASAPDGTELLAITHRSADKSEPHQVLRVWNRRRNRYSFLKELITTGDDISNLSAEFFHFRGKLYFHLMTLHSGHAYIHEDEIFRVERNALTPIRQNTANTVKLAAGESIAKDVFQTFGDDDLHFEFGIWKGQDPECCPSSKVSGTYTIVGNELRIATWKRTND
jgi:HEAT repeat protein